MGAGKWVLALPMALGFPGRLTGGGGGDGTRAIDGQLWFPWGARSWPLQVRGGFLGFQASQRHQGEWGGEGVGMPVTDEEGRKYRVEGSHNPAC